MRLTPDEIRAQFSTALSDMYRLEVPLYGDLLRIVADINGGPSGSRIAVERHGAIRLGKPSELALVARLFGVMGMVPVGYYDLAPSGVPVHSTAFRPISEASLAANPFRMFTSLLRVELIQDPALRGDVQRIVSERRIMSDRAIALIGIAEEEGLTEAQAAEFIKEALRIFRWRPDASVSRATYQRLRDAHPLIADVVCFKGPHVNHLTPRTIDIDAAHAAMREQGMVPKENIEGPPARAVPILLRQTSFKAREEPVHFADQPGVHTARFGEIEQRGAALTRKGRALYDSLLDDEAPDALRRFPDDLDTLCREGLIFCRPSTDEATCEPIIYEDFLPVSAAGIFRSNLGTRQTAAVSKDPGERGALEAALEGDIGCEMALYEALASSLDQVAAGLQHQ
jgi:uncharacterized glyoxalase superfamily metalloenzyme YdcJ